MASLTWHHDPQRGWTGTDADGEHRAHIVEHPGNQFPWSATSWRGWVVECATLERAQELMDRHRDDSVPPGPKPRERRRHVPNRWTEWAPHPGTLRKPPR